LRDSAGIAPASLGSTPSRATPGTAVPYRRLPRPPGRVGAHSAGVLAASGLLSPAGAAKAAAGLGVAGAAALVGWLQKRPRTPDSSGHQP
jgi:hypothetical protein